MTDDELLIAMQSAFNDGQATKSQGMRDFGPPEGINPILARCFTWGQSSYYFDHQNEVKQQALDRAYREIDELKKAIAAMEEATGVKWSRTP